MTRALEESPEEAVATLWWHQIVCLFVSLSLSLISSSTSTPTIVILTWLQGQGHSLQKFRLGEKTCIRPDPTVVVCFLPLVIDHNPGYKS